MELHYTNWQAIFFNFILVGLILFGFFRFIRFLLPILVKNFKKAPYLLSYLPLVETSGWLFFFSWFTFRFAEIKSIFAWVLAAVLGILIFWLSKFFIKDLLAGLVFRTSGRFKVGDRIMCDNVKGLVKKFSLNELEVESTDGSTMFIPYSKLTEAINIKSESTDQASSFSFSFEVKRIHSPEITVYEISNFVLSLPWSSIQKNPVVVVKEKTDKFFIVDVIAFPVDKGFAKKIENETTKKFQKS
ncbi:MAG: mechanosensitive ion channel [Bacteroidales bacterium]